MRFLLAIFLTFSFTSWAQQPDSLPYIQNDSFVTNSFGFPATVYEFKKNYGKFLTVTKKPVLNIHDASLVDTVYTFYNGKTKIQIYRSNDRDMLISAYIDTDEIPLKYNIKVGDTKVDISKRLKTKITTDKVQVGDLEQGQVYTFTFDREKLISITFEGYLD